ncbi:proline iminopeptidase-family hydrolase [Agrobacterium sp. SHOUNA12C]|uniref:Proline iminopeptidase n=1 Tax=Rhizobium rhizogenes NBRC 13257 TaxID=1220581 RepID=A0AA87QG74_RHIRH|nr:proline iminopeptidase-family hydrolase [Rhizobium rhizogenes]MCJ9720492.1 proline iminopeptidase-family hydrolase [Agrobacterium sp. BETTINA12B]MCJ9757177.1 proline iminopeptidase-family hydrolase [Agrobacterium sp. SHOUNA12C]NTF58114.1 proline iminopeptidase-family hydrolase [Rhizobium rhizogenes]NTF64532.1 proline iminopeptidase-family hydrolase [Rhizobium rhizogenes]NTF77696.1 proline iminopeptidase-family hydrolase [Rhizobium rhizogenes]
MWREMQPDERMEVEVDGRKVIAYSFGSGAETVFCLNGGPGLPCDYLREAHSCLVDRGYRVVAFDQLGTGASDRPTDPALWTIGRYVEETETVRKALGLGKVHMLGHSWGGWLAIDYALTYPENLQTLILEDTVADMPHLISELERLRAALGSETVAMMQKHEAQGTYDHPEYMAAVTILNYRHVCRLPEWPAPVRRSLDDWNMGPYATMQGPNEFLYIGNLKDWNRIPDLPRMTVPTLITVGEHDELTPACALRMKLAIPNAELKVFANASHMPFYENPGDYYPALLDFLARHRQA